MSDILKTLIESSYTLRGMMEIKVSELEGFVAIFILYLPLPQDLICYCLSFTEMSKLIFNMGEFSTSNVLHSCFTIIFIVVFLTDYIFILFLFFFSFYLIIKNVKSYI